MAFAPSEEDGSKEAADFVAELRKGDVDAAWDRTAVVFQEESDFNSFAEQAKTYFGPHTYVTVKRGDAPSQFTGRIDYDGRPSLSFLVDVSNDEGAWRIRRLRYGP